MHEFHSKSELTSCGTQLPHDGRPAEYKCRRLLNAGEIFAIVVIILQFWDQKTARRSQELQGQHIRSLAVMVRKRRNLTHFILVFAFAASF